MCPTHTHYTIHTLHPLHTHCTAHTAHTKYTEHTAHTEYTALTVHTELCRYWSRIGVATSCAKAAYIIGDPGLSGIQHVMEIITHQKIHNVPGEEHPSIEEIHHPGDVILPPPQESRPVGGLRGPDSTEGQATGMASYSHLPASLLPSSPSPAPLLQLYPSPANPLSSTLLLLLLLLLLPTIHSCRTSWITGVSQGVSWVTTSSTTSCWRTRGMSRRR